MSKRKSRKAFRTASLDYLGWRVNTPARFRRARKDFRRGYAKGKRILPGQGKRLDAALARAVADKRDGKPNASRYFSFGEFACKCGGRYASCRRMWPRRKLLRRLDKYRAGLGKPLTIVSGCRCPGHNKAVGGATLSQHKYGKAADVPGPESLSATRRRGLFGGIGYRASTGRVEHVDIRAGNVSWKYGR